MENMVAQAPQIIAAEPIARAVTFDGRQVLVKHVRFNLPIQGMGADPNDIRGGFEGVTVDVGDGVGVSGYTIGFRSPDDALRWLGSAEVEEYDAVNSYGQPFKEQRIGLGIPPGMVQQLPAMGRLLQGQNAMVTPQVSGGVTDTDVGRVSAAQPAVPAVQEITVGGVQGTAVPAPAVGGFHLAEVGSARISSPAASNAETERLRAELRRAQEEVSRLQQERAKGNADETLSGPQQPTGPTGSTATAGTTGAKGSTAKRS